MFFGIRIGPLPENVVFCLLYVRFFTTVYLCTQVLIAVIAKNLRPINNDDLLKAVGKLRESKFHCGFSTERFAGVGGLD